MTHLFALFERLERRVRFQDWPLVWKFAAAPASMLALFLVSVTLCMAALVYAQIATDRISGRDMADVAALNAVSTHFEHANGEMYRLLADKAATPRTDVAGRSAEIDKELQQARDGLAQFARSRPDQERSKVRATLALMDRYRDATKVVSSMLDIDFASSTAMLSPFRANAEQVVDQVEALAAAGASDAHDHALAVERRIEVMVALVTLSTLLLALVGIVGPMAIGRSVIRPILRIADVTSSLAAHNHDIDLDALDRGDELGQIVSALKTFRGQAIEKEMLERHAEEEERRRSAAVAQATAEG